MSREITKRYVDALAQVGLGLGVGNPFQGKSCEFVIGSGADAYVGGGEITSFFVHLNDLVLVVDSGLWKMYCSKVEKGWNPCTVNSEYANLVAENGWIRVN